MLMGGGGGRGGAAVSRPNAYGLGFFVGDFRNNVYWNHGGNTVGMTAAFGMLPAEKIGAVVLTNLDHTNVAGAVLSYVLERHLKIPVQAVAQTGRGGGGGGGGGRGNPSAPVSSTPALPLDVYTGTYADSLFGEVTVSVQDGKLKAVRAGLNGPLESVNRDNFSWSTGITVVPALAVQFLVGPDGRANTLTISFGGEMWRLGRKPTGGRGQGGDR
jgi:hypothetical protein